MSDWEGAIENLFGDQLSQDDEDVVRRAFVEGNAAPVRTAKVASNANVKRGEAPPGRESVRFMNYGQPHNVQKNRPSVLEDNFEDPYGRQSSRGGGRAKRQAKNSSSSKKKKNPGIPKMTATATLAPPLLPSANTMDVVFATHWVPPTEVPIITEDNAKCIGQELQSLDKEEDVSDEDFDEAFLNCLRKNGGGQRAVDEFLDKVPKSPEYDAFALQMGQLTIYRYVRGT